MILPSRLHVVQAAEVPMHRELSDSLTALSEFDRTGYCRIAKSLFFLLVNYSHFICSWFKRSRYITFTAFMLSWHHSYVSCKFL